MVRLLVVMGLVCSACSAERGLDRTQDDFQSVGLRITGGQCIECFRYLTMEAPRSLRLEDSDGEEVFTVTRDEFAHVRNIYTQDTFRDSMTHPMEWRCSALGDIEVFVEMRWNEARHR